MITLGAISYLRHKLKDATIDYGVPASILPLFSEVKCDASSLFGIDFKSLSGIFSFLTRLRASKYDLIIELHQSGRSEKILTFFSLLTRTKYIFNNHQKTKQAPATLRDLRILLDYFNEKNEIKALDYPPKFFLPNTPKKEQVVFGVVATRETKMWPLTHFVELAQLIKSFRPSIEIIVPLSASKMDQEIKDRLSELDKNKILSIVEKPLSKLPAMFCESLLYVGNDTGLKHIAIASGIRTITLFGPEEPYEWHPYDLNRDPYLFIHPLECRTRIYHYCPLSHCDSMICLKEITAREVFLKVEQILLKTL